MAEPVIVKQKATQPPPYIRPLPYYYSKDATTLYGPEYTWVGGEVYTEWVDAGNAGFDKFDAFGDNNSFAADSLNKALDEFTSECQQQSDLMVAMLEYQQSLDMVADLVGGLVRTARAIKRRDPRIVRQVLRKKNLKKRDVATTPSGLWLQYHFGIVPTIHDIHAAMNLFSEPPKIIIKGRGSAPIGYDSSSTYSGVKRVRRASGVVHSSIRAELSGLNQHALLAARFGFDQPLSVIYEMTPFSWFVDYFVNLGDMLKNIQPRFTGLNFMHGCHSQVSLASVDGQDMQADNSDLLMYYQGQSVQMYRRLGIPSYQLTLSSPMSLSTQRVTYITSVLVQLLSGMK